ncbi:MAG: Calx-beta domain-containing protein, partial [Leptolyngbyaceae cyanobacterium]
MKRDPDHSLKQARKVKFRSGSRFTQRDRLDLNDRGDLYVLDLKNLTLLDLSLLGKKGKMRLELYAFSGSKGQHRKLLRDIGRTDFGKLTKKQRKRLDRIGQFAAKLGKGKSSSFDDLELGEGIYYIRIFQKRPKKTRYTLELEAQPFSSSPEPPPLPEPPPSEPPISPVLAGVLSFSAPEFQVNEDGVAVVAIAINRTNGTSGTISATLNLTDGSATSPQDYDSTPIVVEFADGEATKVIEVPIVDDALVENTETINLSLATPTNGASLGDQTSAILVIKDNDTPLPPPTNPGVLSFAASEFEVDEAGVAIAVVVINRADGTSGAVSATVSVVGGTATAGQDY